MGDFNINFLNYESCPLTHEFLGNLGPNQRIFSKININTFINEVKDTNWNEILNESNDPEKAYNQFLEVFLHLYETNFPIKQRINKTHINKNKSPWITNCILKSVRKKNRLYKTYLLNPTDKNKHIHKKYKNKLNHIVKIAKKCIMKLD